HDRKVCGVRSPRALSLGSGQLLEETGQGGTDRVDGVGVVRVGRGSRHLEVRPFTEDVSPLDVGIANEFLQQVIRAQDLPAVSAQNDERLIKVIEQKFALLDATEQNDFQSSPGVGQVMS